MFIYQQTKQICWSNIFPLVTLETEMNTSGFENNKDLHVNLSQEFTKGGLMIMHVRLYIMSLRFNVSRIPMSYNLYNHEFCKATNSSFRVVGR